MKLTREERQTTLLCALAVTVGIVLSSMYFYTREKDILQDLRTTAATLRTSLIATSDRLDRNEPSSALSSLLTQCTDPARFDDLLSRLNSLTPSELLDLEHMFDICGDYPSLVKRLTLKEFDESLTQYESISRMINVLKPAINQDDAFLVNMKRISTLEQQRSEQLRVQTQVQKQIISLLKQKDAQNIERIKELVRTAGQTATTLQELNAKIDSVRSSFVQE